MYKTKTAKKNALKSIENKATKLYLANAISIQSLEKIKRIVDGSLKRVS
tara:strand:- start:2988 stop:3134 length:147 start_codon:yes stop_codon:yes gene_type:complete